jgi:glutamate 5-kinase
MTKTIVVKIGTTSVTAEDGQVDHESLARVAADVADLCADGVRVVVVTSGAITAGWSAVGAGRPRPRDPQVLQAVSAVGQPRLMEAWQQVFAARDLTVGQVLMAPLDFADRRQYLKARSTLQALWQLGVVPIVNENDAVADEEIRFGDNDRLAALIANLVGAQRLILLTDTEGLFTADPHRDEAATLIEEVRLHDTVLATFGDSHSSVGSGGMASKVAAARMASWSGITTVITAARQPDALKRATDETPTTGTVFHARPDRLTARETWIAFASPARGTLVVNDGAAAALRRHASLLRVGIERREGTWNEGDAVAVTLASGEVVAKGLCRVASADYDHATDAVIVHADDLVVMP